jgi:hypothetical protein
MRQSHNEKNVSRKVNITMNTLKFDEVFEFKPEFLNIFTFLANKYSHEHASYSVPDISSDLKKKLGCIAVAIFRLERVKGPIIDYCFPSDKKKDVSKVLNNDKVAKYIDELLRTEFYNGKSFSIDVQKNDKKYSVKEEVDLILLPRLALCEKNIVPIQFFIFLDPVQLKHLPTHQAERDFQRTMLAQFLYGWWVKFTAPKSRLAQSVDGSAQLQVFPRWLYLATLPELLNEGKASAKYVRCNECDKEIYFDGESDNHVFNWGEWNPRYTSSGFVPESINEFRNRGKNLVYWCRWIGSHQDLENEQTAFDISNGGKNLTTKWVQKRRSKIDIIDERLEELRIMAANAFLADKSGENLTSKMGNKLSIGRETLLCFSLYKWLTLDGQGCLRSKIVGSILSNIEFCRLLHGISTVGNYLLGNQLLTDDVIHRLTQLVARYGHDTLGIPARIDLRTHLLQAARGEPVLHVLKPFYRDHFFHALEVCFLGHVLLETKLDENLYLWNLVAENLSQKPDKSPHTKNDVLKVWYLAALLHDIGYAMDVLNGSRDYLNFFEHSKALSNLGKSFEQAIVNLSKEEEMQELGIDINTVTKIERDHGVIGALHVHSLIRKIAQEDRNVCIDEYIPVFQAIALHNLRGCKEKISFSKQPLAFLLTLCDQLQEWRRPRLTYSTSPNWMLSRLGGGDLLSTNSLDGAFKSMMTNLETLLNNQGEIDICFHLDSDGHPHLAVTMEYNNQVNRNSGVFQMWLDTTLNFQRLDFDGLPLEITITYVTPFYKGHNGAVELSQLHRLRDAAHETHMSFLTDWFPTRQEKKLGNLTSLTNDAISYHCDDREWLTINLRMLSKKILITKGIDSFWRCLSEWKNFNDDRDFPGDYVSIKPG